MIKKYQTDLVDVMSLFVFWLFLLFLFSCVFDCFLNFSFESIVFYGFVLVCFYIWIL